jgi:hypothetical protein
VAISGVELSQAQVEAVTALVTCRSLGHASSICGTPERTLSRWLNLPEFQQALRRAENALLDAACQRLAQTAVGAVTTLETIMLDIGISPAVRTRAASVLLSNALALRQEHNIELRLSELEAIVNENGNAIELD